MKILRFLFADRLSSMPEQELLVLFGDFGHNRCIEMQTQSITFYGSIGCDINHRQHTSVVSSQAETVKRIQPYPLSAGKKKSPGYRHGAFFGHCGCILNATPHTAWSGHRGSHRRFCCALAWKRFPSPPSSYCPGCNRRVRVHYRQSRLSRW